MLSQSLKLAMLGALLSFNLQCAKPVSVLNAQQAGNAQEQNANATSQEQDPVVTLGEGKLGVIEFLQPFVRPYKDTKAMITTGEYEARQLSGASQGELLIAERDDDEVYSENIYAVSLDGKFQVRSVTGQDWNQAQRIPSSRRSEARFGVIKPAREGIEYRGRVYPHSGKAWTQTEAFPSPSGKWLAVFGDSSEETNTPGIPGISGGGRTAGEMFLDVYDTTTGKKVLAGRAPHRGRVDPGILFDNALWVEDRYLIMPLDNPGEAFFVGILSDK